MLTHVRLQCKNRIKQQRIGGLWSRAWVHMELVKWKENDSIVFESFCSFNRFIIGGRVIHLGLTKRNLKLKSKVEKRENRTRYNVEFLKDQERMDTFTLTLSNKYDTLHDLLYEETWKLTHIWNV